MANKYITELPLTNTLSSGDFIHVDQNNTSKSAKLSAVLAYVNSEIQSNPNSLVINNNNITNNSITSDKLQSNSITADKLNSNVANNFKGVSLGANGLEVKLDGGGGLIFNGGGEIQPVVNNNKGIRLDNGISVKLDQTGGLMFNNSGELKIAPPAATSNLVVVRPSDPSANNSIYVGRTNVDGYLYPYFKTLGAAASWARNNIVGNYTILVDEDTVEGLDADYTEPSDGSNRPAGTPVWWTWNTGNLAVQFINQTTVNNIFGVNSGMKAGLYCWPRISGQKMEGGISVIGGGIGNNTRSTDITIRPRYKRGTAPNEWWDWERYIDDPPRAINSNVYFTNDINLKWNGTTDNEKWGTSATRISNWSTRINLNSPNHGFLYVRDSGLIFINSRGAIVNMNFVSRFNGNDIAYTDIQSCNLFLAGVTLSFLGTGFYNYSLLRLSDKANVHICGMNLMSRVDRRGIYPQNGLSIVGNSYTAGSNLSAATITNHFANIEFGSFARFVEYDAFTPNYSKIRSAVLFDGDFCFNSGYFFRVGESANLQIYPPAFLVNNFNIRSERIDDSQPSRIHPNTNFSLFPIAFNKGNTINIEAGTSIRTWTLTGGSTEANRYDNPPIIMYKGSDTTGLGSFNSATPTSWDYNTTTDDFRASNIGGTLNLPYKTVATMPKLSTYFTFTEGGSTFSLNYGTNVRN